MECLKLHWIEVKELRRTHEHTYTHNQSFNQTPFKCAAEFQMLSLARQSQLRYVCASLGPVRRFSSFSVNMFRFCPVVNHHQIHRKDWPLCDTINRNNLLFEHFSLMLAIYCNGIGIGRSSIRTQKENGNSHLTLKSRAPLAKTIIWPEDKGCC